MDVSDDITTDKISPPTPNRLLSLVLNIMLSLIIFIFIACLIRFVRRERPVVVIITSVPASNVAKHDNYLNLTRNRGYYDFEAYIENKTIKIEKKTHRYFYIDIGCFDGRDIDHFVHFHSKDILLNGTLNIIAFEPDPINFSSCKFSQNNRTNIPTTVYDSAAWIENGHTRYATEKGQKSKIDPNSALRVKSIDFSKWLGENFIPDDYVYIKFTVEGFEIPILEKMVWDRTLALVDYMEIEWHDAISPDFEPRRIVLECMFDNFGMDFIYMINPVDLRHAYNVKDTYSAVVKDKGWKLKDSLIRFHYRSRKEIPVLLTERLQRNQTFAVATFI